MAPANIFSNRRLQENRLQRRQTTYGKHAANIGRLGNRCMKQNNKTTNEELENAAKETVTVVVVPYSRLSSRTSEEKDFSVLVVHDLISKAHRNQSVYWTDPNDNTIQYGEERVPDKIPVNWFTHHKVPLAIRTEIANLEHPVAAHYMTQLLMYYIPEKIKAVFIDTVLTQETKDKSQVSSLMGQAKADILLVLTHATSHYVCGPRPPKPHEDLDSQSDGLTPDLEDQLRFYARRRVMAEIVQDKIEETKALQTDWEARFDSLKTERGKLRRGDFAAEFGPYPRALMPTPMKKFVEEKIEDDDHWEDKIDEAFHDLEEDCRAFFNFVMQSIVMPEIDHAMGLEINDRQVRQKFKNVFLRQLRNLSFSQILEKKTVGHMGTKSPNQANLKAGRVDNAIFAAEYFVNDILPEEHAHSRNFMFLCDLKTLAFFSKFDHDLGRRIISSAVYSKQLSVKDYSKQSAPALESMVKEKKQYVGKKHQEELQLYKVPGVFDITDREIANKLKFARVLIPNIEDIWFFCLPSQTTEANFLFSLKHRQKDEMPIPNWKPFALCKYEFSNIKEGILKSGDKDSLSPFHGQSNEFKFRVRWNFLAESDADREMRRQEQARGNNKRKK